MKKRKQLLIRAMAVCLISAVPSCLYYPSSETGAKNSLKDRVKYSHSDEQYWEWCNDFPRYIIPRICAYYQLHPERFRLTGHGEEIEIEGFAEFVKGDAYFKSGRRASIWSGKIRDPWDEPVRFVQDLNMDGYIEAGGERQKVLEERVTGEIQFTNREHHFGILKGSPFKGPYGSPWERIFAVTFEDR